VAESKVSPIEDTSGREIVITRVFDAPRELVWEAWTDPKHLMLWFGPHGFTNPVCEVDLRPGGVWRHVMRGPDGNDYPMIAIFREVLAPERLVFVSYVPDRENSLFEILNIATFTEQGGKTKFTLEAHVLKSTPEAAPMHAGMEAGWSQSLEHLAGLLARI
jgi:uncharacterized protein YndB with AHSA1/START domain